PPTGALLFPPQLGWPAFWPCSTGGRQNSDDQLHVGAARFGVIDQSIGEPPFALPWRRNGARQGPGVDGVPPPPHPPRGGPRAELFVYRNFRDRTDLWRRCRGHLRAVPRRLEGGRPSGGDGYPGRELRGGRGPSARTTHGSGRGLGGIRADLRP